MTIEGSSSTPHPQSLPPTKEGSPLVRYRDEDEVKKALQIDSWRNLSRDKVVRFSAMMPDMDTELALKVIEQFPDFSRYALDMLDVIQKRHESTLVHNEKSQAAVHLAFQEIRAILSTELEKDDLSWDQKKYLIEQIMETGKLEFEKDSENKRFQDGLFKSIAAAGVAVIALGVVWVGGRLLAQSEENEGNPDDA